MALMYGVIVVLATCTCIAAQTTSVVPVQHTPVSSIVTPTLLLKGNVTDINIAKNATPRDTTSESSTPMTISKSQANNLSKITTVSPATVSTTNTPDTTKVNSTTDLPSTTEINSTTFTPDATKFKTTTFSPETTKPTITTTIPPTTITPSTATNHTTLSTTIPTTNKEYTETTTETPPTTSAPPVPPEEPNTWLSVFLSVFIVVAVILLLGVGVWFIRRRRQLERLRHQLMPMYNFDPTDDVDDWENQLLEEGRSLRPEADKVQMYTGNSTFEKNQTATPTDTPVKD